MRLLVKPIYGWGWYDELGNPVDVPTHFVLEAEVFKPGEPFEDVVGRFPDGPNHLLTGLWIYLTQRHSPHDGNCNLAAYREKPDVVEDGRAPTVKPILNGFALASLVNT